MLDRVIRISLAIVLASAALMILIMVSFACLVVFGDAVGD